jgi:MFS family permease
LTGELRLAPRVGYNRYVRRALIAIAAGLTLADAAVVVLALPPILLELHTSVEGVAAVIGVYTAALALALPLVAMLHTRWSGTAGALAFAAASIGCASADSLGLLLVMRAVQALSGAALLAAAFDALDGGGAGRRPWLAAAVAGTAAGPALGGVLTELFDWRAIFIAQAPIALASVPAFARSRVVAERERLRWPSRDPLAALALALLSGALTAVVFLLVLLLVSGWSIDPLAAAAAVSVLPLSAVAGSLVLGAPGTRAVAGCLLVAGGIGCLALLPQASALWTIPPQLLAGLGIGMALPALAGELLPERTRGQAAGLLSLRHAGITLALVALAPLVAAELDDQVSLARERGTALVLDSALPPTDKVTIAPRLFAELESDDPRDALSRAIDRERRGLGDEDEDGSGLLGQLRERLGGRTSPTDLRRELDRLQEGLDDVVLAAVDSAFSPAFAVTGGMALLAALLVMIPPGRRRVRVRAVAGALLVGIVVLTGYGVGEAALKPEPVAIGDPCESRERRSVGGLEGLAEGVVLRALDRAACRFGSSREELVLALFDEQSRRAYEHEYGVDPRSLDDLLRGVVGL